MCFSVRHQQTHDGPHLVQDARARRAGRRRHDVAEDAAVLGGDCVDAPVLVRSVGVGAAGLLAGRTPPLLPPPPPPLPPGGIFSFCSHLVRLPWR